MGWNTSVIAPPEGHMGSYLGALERLLPRTEAVYFPGHGGPIREPQRFVKALLLHRRWRESEVLDCVRQGVRQIELMVPRLYPGLDPALQGAAQMSILAHIELLVEKGLVSLADVGGNPSLASKYSLTGS